MKVMMRVTSIVFWASAAVVLYALVMASMALHQPVFAQPYPRDAYGNVATPVVASFSGADVGGQTVTLPAAVGKTTYICGVSATGLGATGAATVLITISPLVGNVTFNFQYQMPSGNSSAAPATSGSFSPCIPANAQNTAITVSIGGAAGNTSTQLNVYGYQL